MQFSISLALMGGFCNCRKIKGSMSSSGAAARAPDLDSW